MSEFTVHHGPRFLRQRDALWQVAVMTALALGALACTSQPRLSAPTVEAGGERLVGAFVGGGADVAAFKGIPYAAPPVGELRWKPPMPHTPRPGVQQATEYAPSCLQAVESSDFYRHIAETFGQDPNQVPGLGPTSENCLYLNVWTANLGGRELRPVMLWIHGGANANGTPVAVQTDGTNLARKGVVVVSINYRLNLFGFLAHPALTAESEHRSSGNYALLDQIAALEWVQRNARAFGGDPGRVTVFGESAGGTNITYLLASPLARGLFHRAVIQSGGYAVGDFRTLGEAETVGTSLGEALGLTGSKDALAALRAAPVEDLRRAWLGIRKIGTNAPNVDGWVLPAATGKTFDRGGQHDVPVVVGYNADEWTALRHYWPIVTLDGFRQVLRAVYGPLADRAIELYPATTDAEAAAAADRWQTDFYYVGPSSFIAERVAKAGGRAYLYVFSRRIHVPGGEKLGAHHGIEIPYVWDTLASETWVPRQPRDQELASAMSGAWVRFAATGDPNGGGLPAWPIYSGRERGYLELGDDAVRAGTSYRTPFADLYEQLLAPKLADRAALPPGTNPDGGGGEEPVSAARRSVAGDR
jgi:para-nitrobenzyl esterase